MRNRLSLMHIKKLLETVEYRVEGHSLTARSNETGAFVKIRSGLRDTVESFSYAHNVMDKKVPIHVHIQALYKKNAPSGMVRTMMSRLIQLLPPDQIVCLEASGEIAGDFAKLVAMYQRMGFEIAAYNDERVYKRLMEGKSVILAEHPGAEIEVLMVQPVSGLLRWCNSR